MNESKENGKADGGQAWMWILGSIAAVVVVCFCCCGGGVYLAVSQVSSLAKNMVTEDPVIIEERKEEMARIDLPELLKPKAAMNIFVMKMVVYQSDDERNNLMLATMPKQPGESEAELRDRMKTTVDESSSGEMKSDSGKVLRMEDRTYVINGEPATFQFREIEADDGSIRHMYLGMFKGRTQNTMMILNVYPEDLNEESVEVIFNSMR